MNLKKTSKLEVINSLKESIRKNSHALDSLENWINSLKYRINYNEKDFEAKEDLEVLQYMYITLQFLDKQYKDSLKRLGVRL